MREPQSEARQARPSAAEPPEVLVARLAQVELSVAAGVVLVARLVQVEVEVPAWAALVVLVAKGHCRLSS
jgi:hypothetical protein